MAIPPLTGQQVCDEVAFRIMNRLPANGTGAGSIIGYANDTLGLIGASDSWVFNQSSSLSTAPDSIGRVIASTFGGLLDVGKKISVFDTATGVPIVRTTQNDYQASVQGYVGVNTTTSYNTFRTAVDSGGSTFGGYIQCFPQTLLSSPAPIDIYYHLIMPVLVYGASPTVPWTIPEMDDLLKDWTEAKVKRILGMAGWDTLWADCLGRLGELRKMYTTDRENMGPQDEAADVRQEKNTVGRA